MVCDEDQNKLAHDSLLHCGCEVEINVLVYSLLACNFKAAAVMKLLSEGGKLHLVIEWINRMIIQDFLSPKKMKKWCLAATWVTVSTK